MPQLDSTWFASQIFWLVVTFAALYFILSRLVLPPLVEVLSRRRDTLTSDIDKAQRAKTDAEEARLDYEQTMAEARLAAQQLVNEAMLAQKTSDEQALRKIDAEITAKLAEAEKKIDRAKRELSSTLNATAVELAGMIVEKLTHKAPESGLVSDTISQLSKTRGR